jgi:hypothetical protein|tara:strand:+ start:3412 stop:3642 length:231 start_codon:yes stop_codon:yes gene_type:complete
MVALVEKSDPRYFSQTSDKMYDRHLYKVVTKTGDATVVNNWEDAACIWWNKKKILSHIEVLDILTVDRKRQQIGFG